MSMELTRPDIRTEGCSSAVVDSGLVQSFGGPSAPSHALLEESGARLDDQTTLALSSFPPASDEPLNQAVLRARGRPRIKPIIYGPKRRRGRPSGSGSKPKHQAKLRQRSPTIPHVSNPIIRDTLIPMPGTHRRGAFLQPVIAAQVVEPTEKDLETEATFSSPLQATYPIIQDEDPNSVIQDDVDASDEETNADGKGIGEDDDCDDIGPEDDGGSREGRKRRPLPGWLLDAFNERVEESKQRDAQGLPPLYLIHRSFWFPQKSSFFILDEKKHLSPSNLFNPKFFLWDPQALYPSIPCPQWLQHWMDIKYETFLPFDDKSLRGRHGFVPGSEWLRDMYDTYIEGHQHDFNQHMAMLTGEVTKQIARVDGEQVFTALLTVTNEKGEIRICNFVATKSHSQFETALTRMWRSLEQYGHSQPVLFYTDNMANKQFLENSFPSLRNDVIPIEEYSHLQPLVIPSEIRIMPMDTVQSINHAISTILDDVPVDNGEIAVGFDLEWNVELSPQGFVRCAGKTAVIQIAYKSRIYILQVSNMIAQGKLPQQLEIFLSHPRVRKVGRLVDGDLQRLQDTLRPSQPFVGGVNLAKLAKERHLIKNISKCSLSDLSALVLQKRLTKNTPQRTSQAWENRTLTPEQLDYAAQDAYAALRVYEELITHYSIPTPIPPTVPLLTPVLVFGSDLTNVVAEGQKRSLDGFGTPPFKLVCLRSHLKLYSTPPIHQANQTTAPSYLIPPPSGPSHSYELLIHEHDGTSDGELESQNEVISLQDLLSTDISGSTMNLAGYSVNSENADTEATTSSRIIREIDSASSPSEWDYSIRSRVLKDPWHFFHMLYLPATHGLRKQFTIGTDKKNGGLPIYRCCRGTNATEGGVHTHIRSRLPKFGVSVRHVHASLLDFTLRHNLLTGVYNSTGQRYRGHCSIWVTNEIQELLISLQEMFIQPTLISGWVNGNLYVPTTEVIGILPIPEDIRGQSAMAPYVHSANSQQKHSFIASMQGTRKPVLPVHTHAEEQYFRSLMNSDPSFSPQSGEPKWNEAVQVWNANAESRDGVYYKLVEQLKTYYSRWKAHLNVKEALSLTSEQRRPVTQMVHDPNRSRVVPPVSPRPLQPHHALTGFSEHEPISTDSMANYTQQIETRIQQRVATRLQKKTPIDKPRRPRTCKKCANPNCPEIASHMQG
ncbi:hypothetical protein AGABI1DRAFT_95562 [Agaricus bisporus var. burnettii JB137-S8]|uniref:3'-5' exonuclease n=1 Tax=Agaricus bisporus var. burnettii (strain JB137-S8 / ATCC MYA-4627 / FGSC 10392) TaxID=597362 RepID=K5WVE1_AGABU|nr:uncharacterized protein AGABI1DRAFT_95562 [Agaricus bisporus var. burnettii JB137-S8]EKM74532.1 hypothetical protein AGABI1DRAFT_95562 [Agaricus bisporus var. burnettii JB137-S8]